MIFHFFMYLCPHFFEKLVKLFMLYYLVIKYGIG